MEQRDAIQVPSSKDKEDFPVGSKALGTLGQTESQAVHLLQWPQGGGRGHSPGAKFDMA